MSAMGELHALARRHRWRVSLTMDLQAAGASRLDTLDVWDGRPDKFGSVLKARESLANSTLEAAAGAIIANLTDEGE